jgi:ribosomal-protein-alanine N-acetyltransferase
MCQLGNEPACPAVNRGMRNRRLRWLVATDSGLPWHPSPMPADPDGLRIETARLTLIALPLDAARALIAGDRDRAARILGAAIPEGWPDEALVGILPRDCERLAQEPEPTGFGIWVVIRTEPGIVVGSSGFHGPPDRGEIELGYGIHPDHRNAGYATEAAIALAGWALGHEGVTHVIAECDEDNAASIRVLEKAGLRREHVRAGTIRWKRDA